MKQIEITTIVKQNLKEIDNILSKQGFKIIRKSNIKDRYMSQEINKLNKDNILEVLSKSLIIRYLNVNNKDIIKKLTYKNKKIKDNKILTEEKIDINVDDLDKTEQLLSAIGFKKLVDVKYDVIVYQKDNLEFAFQQVEGLGLLLEYESTKDYENYTNNEILKEKKKMIDEVKKYNIEISNDFDIKKAFELIKKRFD